MGNLDFLDRVPKDVKAFLSERERRKVMLASAAQVKFRRRSVPGSEEETRASVQRHVECLMGTAGRRVAELRRAGWLGGEKVRWSNPWLKRSTKK